MMKMEVLYSEILRVQAVLAFLFIAVFFARAQEGDRLRFVFYNVENLFDTKDDSLTRDDEFTPGGDKGWTYNRYMEKVDRIARVITGIGEWQAPEMIGLCEIENRGVLLDLAAHRLLSSYNYRIIHRDSPDERGIDVAFLYRPESFAPVFNQWLEVVFDWQPGSLTREILHVKGYVPGSDTLHLFINHWPSRWGGVAASEPRRAAAAAKLRHCIDSLFMVEEIPGIIIAGDFNDNPTDASITAVLGAREIFDGNPKALYNLMHTIHSDQQSGTLKYAGDWETYDQIIVSGKLLGSGGLFVEENRAYVYSPPYLLTDDERRMGKKPFRTYLGPAYLGGFSDHLPVYIDLRKREEQK